MKLNLFGKQSKNGNGRHGGSEASYRIGDRVQSARFGQGVVRGHGPQGTVIVRFKTHKTNRTIFPTLLK